jgi:uncharacterized protein
VEEPRPIVCVDTSPCIALVRVALLGIFSELFSEVLIPESVFIELIEGASRDDAWLIHEVPTVKIVPNKQIPRESLAYRLPTHLHSGERDVIILAKARSCIAIIDDGMARKAAASIQLRVTGTVGVLQLAKSRGAIPRIRPILEALVGSGLRLHPELVRQAIEQAGE